MRARVLILLILGTQLPFLFQSFHIDDRIYLRVAENILQTPLYPYDFRISFEGMGAPDGASHSHLPLVSYYLALLKWVTNSEAEWVYHLGFLVFPLLAAWGFYDLARRYVRFPLAAACLLVTAPGFLVSSHTVMTDVPFWSLWIVALSRFLRVRDGTATRWDWLIWGASLLGTCFISVLGAGLVLLMVVCLFLREAGAPPLSRGKMLLVLASPLLLWGLWYLRAYLHYDRFLLLNTAIHALGRDIYTARTMGEKTLSLLLNLGGTVLFPVALWYGLAGRIGARVLAVLFLLCFVPFYLWWEDWTWSQALLFALFFSSGVVVFWRFLHGSEPNSSSCGTGAGYPSGSGFRGLPGLSPHVLLGIGAVLDAGGGTGDSALDRLPGEAGQGGLSAPEPGLARGGPDRRLLPDHSPRRLPFRPKLSAGGPGDRARLRKRGEDTLVHCRMGLSTLPRAGGRPDFGADRGRPRGR